MTAFVSLLLPSLSAFVPSVELGPPPATCARFSAARVSPAAIHANVYDDWWEDRRSRNLVGRAQSQVPSPPALVLEPLPFDEEGVTQALAEFVNSEYALTVFRFRQCSPTDFGEVFGMFYSVELVGESKILLRLKQVFDERNTDLLERVARYLRARIPDVKQVTGVHRDGTDMY